MKLSFKNYDSDALLFTVQALHSSVAETDNVIIMLTEAAEKYAITLSIDENGIYRFAPLYHIERFLLDAEIRNKFTALGVDVAVWNDFRRKTLRVPLPTLLPPDYKYLLELHFPQDFGWHKKSGGTPDYTAIYKAAHRRDYEDLSPRAIRLLTSFKEGDVAVFDLELKGKDGNPSPLHINDINGQNRIKDIYGRDLFYWAIKFNRQGLLDRCYQFLIHPDNLKQFHQPENSNDPQVSTAAIEAFNTAAYKLKHAIRCHQSVAIMQEPLAILKKNIKLDYTEFYRELPATAAAYGNVKALKLLGSVSLRANGVPVVSAIKWGQLDALKVLLNVYPNLGLEHLEGIAKECLDNKCFSISASRGHMEMMDYLFSLFAKNNINIQVVVTDVFRALANAHDWHLYVFFCDICLKYNIEFMYFDPEKKLSNLLVSITSGRPEIVAHICELIKSLYQKSLQAVDTIAVAASANRVESSVVAGAIIMASGKPNIEIIKILFDLCQLMELDIYSSWSVIIADEEVKFIPVQQLFESLENSENQDQLVKQLYALPDITRGYFGNEKLFSEPHRKIIKAGVTAELAGIRGSKDHLLLPLAEFFARIVNDVDFAQVLFVNQLLVNRNAKPASLISQIDSWLGNAATHTLRKSYAFGFALREIKKGLLDQPDLAPRSTQRPRAKR
jgi:hypothetical protein